MTPRTAPSPPDLLLAGLALAVLVAVLGLDAGLMFATAVVTVAFGGSWGIPSARSWVSITARLVSAPGHPAAAFGPPWSAVLAGRAVPYWAATLAMLALAGGVAVLAVLRGWRRWGPVPGGHASRAEIRAELSLAAARATAEWTRPSLSPAARHRARLDEVAVPLHRNPYDGTPMASPLENPTGTLAPTQAGKSRRDLVHKALAAPGALLCSTTKADLLEFTALARARRGTGPVLVYDATGTLTWPAVLRWSPLADCQDPAVAYRRAHTMVEAAAIGLREVTGNDKVFRDRAKIVLQAYFLAAADAGRGVRDVVRWAIAKPPDHDPIGLLRAAGYPDHARNLRDEIAMVDETSDAVWLAVRRVVEPWLDDRLAALCTPRPGEAFDAHEFIRDGGSLYLVAGQHQAAQAAPILTALVEYWLTTAQDMALDYPTRRVDPTVTAVLDELTTATPVPQLPAVLADSAGRGVLVHWGDQSLAALEGAYGELGARRLMDNTTTLSVWGGLKDQRTLEWVSLLAGHHDRRRWQVHHDGTLSPGRTAMATETVPTFRPGAVRGIRRGRVLVIHRHLNPILARTRDVTKRPDWTTIRADLTAVRTGQVAVSATGYPLAPEATPPHPTPEEPPR